VRAAKIPPIAPQNPEVEPEIEEVCRKALAKRMEDRFQTATDLQDALAHYLFSRGLKMIQRDISDLVRGCLEDLATLSGAKRPKPNIIDTLLHEEIHSFTSLEFNDQNAAQPPRSMTGEVPTPGDYVDPRAWADDPDWSGRRTGNRRTTGSGRRPTGPGVPPPPPSSPVVEAAFARRAAPDPMLAPPPRPPSLAAGGLTPPPDRLADALEPMPRPAARSGPTSDRWLGRGVLIGVVLGAAALGALFAALWHR
jgi:hypothetical protein